MRALPRKAAGSCCSLTTQPATDTAVNNGDFAFRKCRKTTVPERKQIEIIKKYCKKLHFGVGKDEVPSSNLGSSSKIPLESIDSGGISFVFTTF